MMAEDVVLVILVATLAILALMVVGAFVFSINRDFDTIQKTLYEKYVEYDPRIGELERLAIEVWKLKKNIKDASGIDSKDRGFLENRVRQMEKYLDKNQIEIDDYEGRKYSDGMSGAEVVKFEKDADVSKPFIKETVQPAIKYKGVLRKKAQVIVVSNEG